MTLTILLVVVTINAVNFIDGLDGLAAGIVASPRCRSSPTRTRWRSVTGTRPARARRLSSAVLAGACLGFLPHNFYPARIFMGDIRLDAARPAARLTGRYPAPIRSIRPC